MPLSGRIIEEQKNYFVVDTPAGRMRTTLAGALRRQRPAVGDNVAVEIINDDTREAVMQAIGPRKNFIARPPLANMDQMVLMTTMREPELDIEGVDRFLFTAAVMGLSALVVVNKTDILSVGELEKCAAFACIYRASGYPVIALSALAATNALQVADACRGKFCFLAGASGVGKTTLLATLFPQIEYRTAPLSTHSQRGVHTTTSISLMPISVGGYIADTPGFSCIELPAVPPRSVISYFPDMARFEGACRFNDCMHESEPGCVLKAHVGQGLVAAHRYEHYIKILHEMKAMRSSWK